MRRYNPHIHHRKSIRLKGYDYARAGLYFITICCHERERLFGEVVNGRMELNAAGKTADECWKEIPAHFPHVILHEHIIMPNHVHGIIELQNINHVGAKNISPHINRDTNAQHEMAPHSDGYSGNNDETNEMNVGAKNISPHAHNDANAHHKMAPHSDDDSNNNDEANEMNVGAKNISPHAHGNTDVHNEMAPDVDDDSNANYISHSNTGAKDFSHHFNEGVDAPNIGDPSSYKISVNTGAKDFSPLRSPSKTVGSVVRGFKIGVTKWMRKNSNVHTVWQRNYFEHIIRDEQSYHIISNYIKSNPSKWQEDDLYRE
jgi:putative transposase